MLSCLMTTTINRLDYTGSTQGAVTVSCNSCCTPRRHIKFLRENTPQIVVGCPLPSSTLTLMNFLSLLKLYICLLSVSSKLYD